MEKIKSAKIDSKSKAGKGIIEIRKIINLLKKRAERLSPKNPVDVFISSIGNLSGLSTILHLELLKNLKPIATGKELELIESMEWEIEKTNFLNIGLFGKLMGELKGIESKKQTENRPTRRLEVVK